MEMETFMKENIWKISKKGRVESIILEEKFMKEASKKAEGLGMEDYALEVEWS